MLKFHDLVEQVLDEATEPANKGAESKDKKDDFDNKGRIDRMKADLDAGKEDERLRGEREKESLETEKEKLDREVEKEAKRKEAISNRAKGGG